MTNLILILILSMITSFAIGNVVSGYIARKRKEYVADRLTTLLNYDRFEQGTVIEMVGDNYYRSRFYSSKRDVEREVLKNHSPSAYRRANGKRPNKRRLIKRKNIASKMVVERYIQTTSRHINPVKLVVGLLKLETNVEEDDDSYGNNK